MIITMKYNKLKNVPYTVELRLPIKNVLLFYHYLIA